MMGIGTERRAALPRTGSRRNAWLVCAAMACLLGWILPGRAQNAIPTGNAKVEPASQPVYAEMSRSSEVVRTLHAGEEVALDFEVASASGSWCSVRLPGGTARLGYVPCASLAIENRPLAAGPFPPGSAASPSEPASSAGGGGNSRRPRIHLSLAPPVSRFLAEYRRVAALVVKEEEVDTVKLDKFDAAAQAGGAAARTRAALAHDAAGNFALAQNETGKAVDQFGLAVGFAPDASEVRFASLLSLAYAHLLRSEYSAALEVLDRARALAPDSVAVARLSGWAYYGLDQSGRAIEQWQTAQRLQPDPQVAQLLAKTERDQAIEKTFHETETAHFILRYQGAAAPGIARDILATLEDDFRNTASIFQFTPPERIAVIVYTEETFRDVTRAPRWSGGIYDGRIRVPVQGLTSVTGELARVLAHELTHSFIRQMTQGRCPQWLNEGLAEWMEGRRSVGDAQALVAAYEQGKYIPLRRLEGSWNSFPVGAARFAYGWSLAAVEAIIANSGMWGIQRLLESVGQGVPAADALGPALQLTYPNLELETAQYLRRTYLQ
jgi:tetratricopeptide (TPR) repeat protein